MRAIINILRNNTALTTLLGGVDQIGANIIGQTKNTPYVVVDLEDSTITNTFKETNALDMERITIFSVADQGFTNGSTIGADEVSVAVRRALDYVSGTFDGEIVERCTLQRGLPMREDRISNKPQITKEDEYLLVVRSKVSLPSPTNLVLSNISGSSIQLDWDLNSNGDETSVLVKRNEGGAGFVNLIFLAPGSETHTDTTVSALTTYEYAIFAEANQPPD